MLWKHIAYVDWLSLNAFLLAKFASSIDCSPDLALPLELKIIDKAANTTITIKMVLMTILPFALALSISELLKNKISHKWIVFNTFQNSNLCVVLLFEVFLQKPNHLTEKLRLRQTIEICKHWLLATLLGSNWFDVAINRICTVNLTRIIGYHSIWKSKNISWNWFTPIWSRRKNISWNQLFSQLLGSMYVNSLVKP